MHSEMVERVASAIFSVARNSSARKNDNKTLFGKHPVAWEDAADELVHCWIAEDYRRQAHAAVAAMLEPTPAMIRAAGYKCENEGDVAQWMDTHDWPVMINAALKET